MRWLHACGFLLTLGVSSACLGEQWEIGGAAGYGRYRDATVTNPAGAAQAGFQAGAAGGVVIGEDLYHHLGGEFRYTYRSGALELKSGGSQATMDGQSHAFHYDLLWHATRKGSRVRPFAAGGGGIKWFRATGSEHAFQPLSNFAMLTKTSQNRGLITFGGGVKVALAKHTIFRADFRDYLTPFPDKLFLPARGAKVRGWLHDFVPMAGISFVF